MQRAGKPQKKFVLLGRPRQKVAAVIVEANKFAFIYNSVETNASNGIHQVILLRLCADLAAAVHSKYTSSASCMPVLIAWSFMLVGAGSGLGEK